MPDAAHHVTQRGNYRQDVFFTPEDRREYLRYLRQSAAQNGLEIAAYCLMTNHVHRSKKGTVPRRVQGRPDCGNRSNTRRVDCPLLAVQHSTPRSHLWQSRFYSNPMDDAHAWNAMAYVERNPLRAGMVRNPWDYPWSSAAVHCGKGADAAGLLSLETWRDEVTPKHWRETLAAFAAQTGHHELLRAACRTGRPLGDDVFLSKLEAYLGHRLPRYGRGRPKGSKDNRPRNTREPNSQKKAKPT
ncbi:transposase [Roseovarius pacificus]|uniref:transposase n=1 Tax=Roseovarius pacificus TaxID=337701 RepID=UPI002A188182|nr:transposase [Roseovarius pacificus]